MHPSLSHVNKLYCIMGKVKAPFQSTRRMIVFTNVESDNVF